MNENIKAGADIHAGDGGYEEGTWEKHDEFVKARNQSLIKSRTREFERESGLEIYALGARRDKWEHCMQRFAELIIQECINTLEFHGEDRARDQLVWLARNRFGINTESQK